MIRNQRPWTRVEGLGRVGQFPEAAAAAAAAKNR